MRAVTKAVTRTLADKAAANPRERKSLMGELAERHEQDRKTEGGLERRFAGHLKEMAAVVRTRSTARTTRSRGGAGDGFTPSVSRTHARAIHSFVCSFMMASLTSGRRRRRRRSHPRQSSPGGTAFLFLSFFHSFLVPFTPIIVHCSRLLLHIII